MGLRSVKVKIDKNIPPVIGKLGYLINPLLLNFMNETNKLVIFYFHGLYESTEQKNLNHVDPQNNITTAQFAEFIDYFLNHKYNFVGPKDLMEGLPAGRRYAMITFDDGYFNNMLAVDILKKYKIPAVFFITTINITENKSYWWDVVYKYRYKQGKGLEAIRDEQAHLKKFKYTEIDKYLESNFGSEFYEPWSDIDRPFTESELKHFAQNPLVSIGNHTHNHTILVNYSKEIMQEEFNVSNKILTGITGTIPVSTAFPNGNYNKLVLDVAEEAGFRFAFTTEARKNILPIKKENFTCLNRLMATTDDIKKYGGFYRLGYKPGTLYSNFKKTVKVFFSGPNNRKNHL